MCCPFLGYVVHAWEAILFMTIFKKVIHKIINSILIAGDFEVKVNGVLVFSKQKSGGFPDSSLVRTS